MCKKPGKVWDLSQTGGEPRPRKSKPLTQMLKTFAHKSSFEGFLGRTVQQGGAFGPALIMVAAVVVIIVVFLTNPPQ